ncbi:MtrAB system histidine kinase MtrB [Actinotignum sp. GS-2025b]|uniref:MtrAB system histidine kinase MtrB n=1 Tax=Actinotignum sp. GS-2025b TaxID=3427275 RepID=UPI003F4724B7
MSQFSRRGYIHRSLGSMGRGALTSFSQSWRTSLNARVVSAIVAIGVLTSIVTAVIVANQTRSQLYDRAVSAATEQFYGARSQAQYVFDSANAQTSGAVQEIANAQVRSQFEPIRGVVGTALIRSPGQNTGNYLVADVGAPTPATVMDVLTPELREAVQESSSPQWQAVAIAKGEEATLPGILIGATVRLPNAGMYEFYTLYSLENEEVTVAQVSRVLMLATVALLTIVAVATGVLVNVVLKPVRAAAENARQLAGGAFDVRMDDRGEDELAQLGSAFNQMAESLQDQFTRLERLSQVQQNFVSAVSHELRTPVTTIRMAGQLIYDKRSELPSSLRRSAELQHSQLISLDTMLSDLLEISRFDAGSMVLETSKIDVVEIVRRVIISQAPLIEANGVPVTLSARGETVASVDSRRIERIVRNLVVNAVEHAEGGPVKVRVVGSDTAVAVEVSDRGIGLSTEQASHVFDRFWRADTSRVRKSGGTGLGLTIAREDALLHEGRLQATGELGVGSTFLLTVPRTQKAAFTPPLPLRVAAAEDWDDSGDIPIEIVRADTTGSLTAVGTTGTIPAIRARAVAAADASTGAAAASSPQSAATGTGVSGTTAPSASAPTGPAAPTGTAAPTGPAGKEEV